MGIDAGSQADALCQLQCALELIASALNESLHCGPGTYHCCGEDASEVIPAIPTAETNRDIEEGQGPQPNMEALTAQMTNIPIQPC